MPIEITPSLDISPATLLNGNGKFPALIVCEHASNHVPDEYDNLGLSQDELQSHIAWDIGAAEVALHLSALLDAPYVRGEVSRLVYDCNRPPNAPDAMPEKSEVFVIPGNQNLSTDDKQTRLERVYEPFKHCIEQTLAGFSEQPALITIHSFTPVYNGDVRAVELGILHDEDTTLADAVLAEASNSCEYVVQRNKPYGPEDGTMHSLKLHGNANHLPNVMIEIRNDLISTSEQCKAMAQTLLGIIQPALSSISSPAMAKETAKEMASTAARGRASAMASTAAKTTAKTMTQGRASAMARTTASTTAKTMTKTMAKTIAKTMTRGQA